MFKSGKNESRNNFKINWKLFILSYLALNVGGLVLAALYILITGWRHWEDNLFLAITISQIISSFLTGMLMGYWAGEWPRWEMMFVLICSFQASLSRNLKEGLDLESLVGMIFFLALYGGSLLGGGVLGIKLKQRKNSTMRIATESEITQDE